MILNQLFNEGTNWHTDPEQQSMDATRRARLGREREPEGSDAIDAKLAANNNARQEYAETGRFWLKRKDSQEHISDAFVGKVAATAAAQELLKQQPELRGNLVITAYGPGEQQPVSEGKVKELGQDLKDKALSDAEFKARYGKTRAEVRAAMREKSVAEGAGIPTDWMGVPTRLSKNDKKPIKRPSGYDEYIKRGAKQGFQDDPTNPLRKKVKEQGVAETKAHSTNHKVTWMSNSANKAEHFDSAGAAKAKVAALKQSGQYHNIKYTPPKGVAEGYQFKGSFPFDVDHMHGGRGINLPKAETKKYFTDKKQWQRAVDDINSSKYDDNSDYIGVTGRSTVEINGREWARWSDAQQKGYIELSSMSEQGVAEGSRDRRDPYERGYHDGQRMGSNSYHNPYSREDEPTEWDEYKSGFNMAQIELQNDLEDNNFSEGVAEGSEQEKPIKKSDWFDPTDMRSPEKQKAAYLNHLAAQKQNKNIKEQGVAEGVRDLGYDAQSLIMKLRRDVEEKRLQPTPQAVLAAARELAGDMEFAPQLLVKQVLGQGVAEGSSTTWEVSFDYGPHQSETVNVKAGSEQEARAKVETAAEKRGRSIMINWAKPAEQDVAEAGPRMIDQFGNEVQRTSGQVVQRSTEPRELRTGDSRSSATGVVTKTATGLRHTPYGDVTPKPKFAKELDEFSMEGNYDRDDYYNARQGREYGKDLTATGYGGDGAGTRRDDIFKGQSKNLPADPFRRTSGAVPYATKGQQHRIALPGEVDEGEKVGNMDADKFDAAMARLKQLAGAGPMKTVYDPAKRVYRNMPTAQQPGNKK